MHQTAPIIIIAEGPASTRTILRRRPGRRPVRRDRDLDDGAAVPAPGSSASLIGVPPRQSKRIGAGASPPASSSEPSRVHASAFGGRVQSQQHVRRGGQRRLRAAFGVVVVVEQLERRRRRRRRLVVERREEHATDSSSS